MNNQPNSSRRNFIKRSGTALAGSFFIHPFAQALQLFPALDRKMKVALVGTGVRGLSMWGREVVKAYHDRVEFVGLSDKNEGRLRLGKSYLEVDCPLYLDFDQMLRESSPDVVIVTTMDSTHHEFIIKGLKAGMHVITEKPMTTDEKKVQAILDAEKASGKQVLVTFNYRY